MVALIFFSGAMFGACVGVLVMALLAAGGLSEDGEARR